MTGSSMTGSSMTGRSLTGAAHCCGHLPPPLARPLLDLSVELIRILVVPVTTFLGPQGMTRTTSSNGARISRYRRESCVNATHLACTKCSGNEGLSARPEIGAGVDLDAPTQR